MKRISMMLAIAAVLSLATLGAQDLDVELQRAIQKEVAGGNLKAAIADYQAIVKRAGSNDAVAAHALLRMADAHRKLGSAEARRIYEDVQRRFPQQKDAIAPARTALAALDAPVTAAAKGPRMRQLAVGIDGMGTLSADRPRRAQSRRSPSRLHGLAPSSHSWAPETEEHERVNSE